MRLLNSCKGCEHYSRAYGCANQECEVYQDLSNEYNYEMRREMEADNEHDRRRDMRLNNE